MKVIFLTVLLFPALSYGGYFVDVTLKTNETEKASTFAVNGCSTEMKFKNGLVTLVASEPSQDSVKIKYEIDNRNAIVLAKGILTMANKASTTLKFKGADKTDYALTLTPKLFRTRPSMLGYYTCEGKSINFED